MRNKRTFGDRLWPVILAPDVTLAPSVMLSAAKNLDIRREILRCAQHDIFGSGRYSSPGKNSF